ncbi:MAG: formimidoylglutamate deiminase [Marinicella sp.]
MNSYFFQAALSPTGWQRNVRATVDQGIFTSIKPNSQAEDGDQQLGVVVPAMPNVHSHVFQRAMAGQTEYKSGHSETQDSFWTWRKLMYKLANEMDVASLYQVAKSCYQEMQDAGYASVCEFHYVHRDNNNFDDYYSLSECLLQAAVDVGLPITLLPVLYAFSGVNDQPLTAQQKRFELSVTEYIELMSRLQEKLQHNQRLGICFHSIRAVNQVQIQTVIDALPKDMPIHIHIAEQQAEIEQALNHYGQRPVAWLYDHFQIDQRWCLVHATHLDDDEIKLIAESKAVAVICPLTEANLGDGIFPMPAFKAQQGCWAIGSDSHIEINPKQELKMLEYSQRLHNQQRNVCCTGQQPHAGTWMWLQAVAGGNQASGFSVAGIMPNCPARVVELNSKHSDLTPQMMLDSWIFSDHILFQAHQL